MAQKTFTVEELRREVSDSYALANRDSVVEMTPQQKNYHRAKALRKRAKELGIDLKDLLSGGELP